MLAAGATVAFQLKLIKGETTVNQSIISAVHATATVSGNMSMVDCVQERYHCVITIMVALDLK